MASDGHAAGSAAGSAAASSSSNVTDRRIAAIGSQLRATAAEDGGAIESLATKIAEMRAEQGRLRDVRKRQAAELKNLQRRKRRLKGKARQLSNEDLLAVLLMRQPSASAASSSSGAAASSSACSSAASAPPEASSD